MSNGDSKFGFGLVPAWIRFNIVIDRYIQVVVGQCPDEESLYSDACYVNNKFPLNFPICEIDD